MNISTNLFSDLRSKELRLRGPRLREPRSGDNLAIEWGESLEDEELEWEDHCKGPHCDTAGIDKL